jgi:hypothetical protein
MILNKDGMQKTVSRLLLSKDKTERQETLVANLLQPGNMQTFSPEMSSILMADINKNKHGNIISLQLK